jgi:hypothetical protein
VTRPTAPSRASWPPARRTEPTTPGTGDGGAAAHLHGPSRLFANVIPLSSAGRPDLVDPATTSGAHHSDGGGEHRDDERDGQTVA